MSLEPRHLFYWLQAKKHSMPNTEPHRSLSRGPSFGVISFSTSNFDSMSKFLTCIGFVVTEGRSELAPPSTATRAAQFRRGNFEFQLEEDTSRCHTANVSMTVGDLSEEEIKRAISGEFEFTREETLYGEVYIFKSPDGGTFLLLP